MITLNKDNLESLNSLLKSEEPIIIIKNFIEPSACKKVREACHRFSKMSKSILGDINRDTFYQIDVLPSKVQTQRIFRSFHFGKDDGSEYYNTVKDFFARLEDFQKKYTVPDSDIPKNFKRFWQIIHYPRGGGFFDWHEHPRYPVNYGLIVNLSEKNREFNTGQTEFKIDGTIIKVDDYADVGDLILFRFDLEHRVAPCDPEEDLLFSSNGRWTAVLPVLEATTDPAY